MHPIPSESSSARRVRRLSASLIAVGLVVAVIGSLGAPLLTAVTEFFAISPAAGQWSLTVTLLAGAAAGPLFGRLGAGSRRRAVLLVALGIVVLGGLFTVLPLSFGVLLAGRALQGVGLGAVPLLVAVARDHLPGAAGVRTIAALSVASTVGIGVGYPLVALVQQLAGLRAAYAVGVVLSVSALFLAAVVVPRPSGGTSQPVDAVGAVVLTAGILTVLVPISLPTLWQGPSAVILLILGIGILIAWVALELRTPHPLVDLRLLARPTIMRANAAMLVIGVAMYLQFSLMTRFLQTPADGGYGFALMPVAAGAALIPFSAAGFLAGRTTMRLADRCGTGWAFGIGGGAVLLSGLAFAILPSSLLAVLLAITVLGYAVGLVSALMPRMILGEVPAGETASAMAMNQVVRSLGFTTGSAVAGLCLAVTAGTRAGYTAGALLSLPLVLLALAVVYLGLRDQRVAGRRL